MGRKGGRKRRNSLEMPDVDEALQQLKISESEKKKQLRTTLRQQVTNTGKSTMTLIQEKGSRTAIKALLDKMKRHLSEMETVNQELIISVPQQEQDIQHELQVKYVVYVSNIEETVNRHLQEREDEEASVLTPGGVDPEQERRLLIEAAQKKLDDARQNVRTLEQQADHAAVAAQEAAAELALLDSSRGSSQPPDPIARTRFSNPRRLPVIDPDLESISSASSLGLQTSKKSVPSESKYSLLSAPDDWIRVYREGREEPVDWKDNSRSAVKMELPRYSGAVLDWFVWIDLFKSLVHDSGKAPGVKFAMLKSHLGGECLDVVYGLGGGEDAYMEALYRLQRRYGNREVMRATHHQALVRLEPRKGEGSFNSLFLRFAERVRTHLFELTRIGGSSHEDTIERVCEKLSQSDRLAWNEYRNRTPEFKTMLEFGDWLCERAACYLNAYTLAAEQFQDRHRPHYSNNNNNYKKSSARTHSTSSYAEKKETGEQQHQRRAPFCFKCKTEGHRIADCSEFKKMTAGERYKFVFKSNLCFSCFAPKHAAKKCNWSKPCPISGCKIIHHVLLHEDGAKGASTTAASNVEEANSSCTTVGSSQIAFGVTTIEVFAADGSIVPATVFFDEGSDTTLFREGFVNRLKLPGEQLKLSVAGVGQQQNIYESSKVHMRVLLPNEVICLTGSTLPKLTRPVPVRDWPSLKGRWKHLQDLPLKPSGGEIDILLGLDYRHLTVVLESRVGVEGQPIGERNRLGWIVSGVIGEQTDTVAAYIHSVFSSPEPKLDVINEALVEQVKRLCDTDSFGTEFQAKPILSAEEKLAVDSLNKSTVKLDVGYQASPLWRPGEPDFENNYNTARHRFSALLRRFEKDPKYEQDYRKAMNKYTDNNYVREVKDWTEEDDKQYFLTHHGVYKNLKDKEDGKLRIVFNAAEQCRNRSKGRKCLNDALYPGPSIVAPLTSVLLRFCEREVAWAADIGAHFSRVRVSDQDARYLRFIWVEKGSKYWKIMEKIRLPFGLNCAPYIAVSTTRRAVVESGADPSTIKAVEDNMYMDDYLGSSASVEEGIKEAKAVSTAVRYGDFHLDGWVSNSQEFLNLIRENQQEPTKQLVKILGILWDTRKDTLSYRFDELEPITFTLAGILSKVASVYDPLGVAAPLTVKAKWKLREMSQRGVKWKDLVVGEDRQWWEKWFVKVKELEQFEKPRCLFPNEDQIKETTMVGFGDASEEAGATSIYLRHLYKDGSVQVKFVKGATKLAPKTRLSIPKLELNASLLTARVMQDVQKQLTRPIHRRVAFTDSSSVRNWLRSLAADYKPFTGNRIGEIQLLTRPEEWRFVPGKLNPADLATRSAFIDGPVIPKLWTESADFLLLPEEQWPQDLPWMPVKEEMKKVKVHQVTVEKTDWTQVKIGVEDWPHLLEKDGTFLKLVKKCQEEVYAADLRRLQKKKSVRGDSSLVSLAPILGEDGLLRLGGRCGKAKLPYEVLHPPIIPASHPLASIIAKACHERFTHAGTDFVLAQLRQVVWVTRGRSVVKRIRLSCLQCVKERAKPGIQLMADLPACRLDYESPAFTQTSVDCFGPFECETSRNRTKKVWGCLFTCLVTRALYVTAVESISTEDFLLALRQLVAIYGRPKRLWLDNGTNFVGAERELREAAQRVYESQGFQEYLKRKGIEFTFQPPRTPHWGGSHESQVKCVKKSLYRAMGAESNKLRHPTINMLRTIFYEIAGLLNTRPLTYVSSDPLDFRPITPADFLARPAVADFPAEEGLDADPRQKYAYVQKCVNLAWSFWKSAFLQDLASRRKWRNVERNFAVGDFVMEVDDQLKRGEWRTGRIVAVYPSSDGLVRAVDFQTETGTYRRGIVRLALLEPAKSSAGSPSSSTASGEHGSADSQDSAKSS